MLPCCQWMALSCGWQGGDLQGQPVGRRLGLRLGDAGATGVVNRDGKTVVGQGTWSVKKCRSVFVKLSIHFGVGLCQNAPSPIRKSPLVDMEVSR